MSKQEGGGGKPAAGGWRLVVQAVLILAAADIISPGLHRRVELRLSGVHTPGNSQCQLFTGPTMHHLPASSSSVESHGRLTTKQAFPLTARTERMAAGSTGPRLLRQRKWNV